MPLLNAPILGLAAVATIAAFALSLALTGVLVRRFSAPDMLDVPNERSSHVRPTPRGGGLAIALAATLGWFGLLATGAMAPAAWFAFGLAGGCVALVGFLDDRRWVSLGYRLAFHLVAGGLAATLVGGLAPLTLFGARIDLGLAGDMLAVLFVAWSVNLFNFMDGVDGLAGSQAVVAFVAAAVLAPLAGLGAGLSPALMVLAAAVAGFLAWNLPPAKIFMGSVGSEFLGFCLGVSALALAQIDPRLFWAATIMMAALASDATMTLAMRFAQGENVLSAHRTHAYQLLAQGPSGHGRASAIYLAIQLLYLAPLAALTALGRLDGLAGAAIAYAPLCLGVALYRSRWRTALAG